MSWKTSLVHLALFSVLLSLAFSAKAQQPRKTPKIGWLIARPASSDVLRLNEMTQGVLRDRGYIEGKTVTHEFRYADNKLDRLPALAEELVSLKVDVILAASTNAALAAQQATTKIPIVFVSTADPVATGLVADLAHPSGNLTGFTTITPVLTGKRLELLKETVPGISHIGFMFNPKNPGSRQDWKESQLSARDLGLQLYAIEVAHQGELDPAVKKAANAGIRAFAVTLDGMINSNQKKIGELAIKNRIPVIYPRGDFVESGGLMSYGPDQAEPYRRVAWMTDKVLKGTKPAEIPVEQPTKFDFVINLKTAKQIGLTIPPSVLARADRVIK